MTMTLEPLAPHHVPAIAAMVIEDPDILRFTRVPEPAPPGFAEGWVARYENGRAEGTSEGFAIVDADGTFLGLALAPTIDRTGKSVELGYLVVPAARGRGVAGQALRQLTEWAFAEVGALRAELRISVDNAASQRVAERAGYVKEGVLRSVHFKQDLWEDEQIWSRLATDPLPE